MRKVLIAAAATAVLSCFAANASDADSSGFVQCRTTEAVVGPDMLPSNDGLSVPSRTTMGEKSVADVGAETARLNAWLRAEAPRAKGAGVSVTMTRAEGATACTAGSITERVVSITPGQPAQLPARCSVS